MKLVKNKKIIISKASLLIILLGFSFLPTIFSQENTENKTSYVLAYTPHAPISITDDSGFSVFPGAGTSDDPYVIEGYDITTSDLEGIYISSTTKYFVIKDCYIDANSYGIHIDNIADGTAEITNNSCINNALYGIWIASSNNNSISNNLCTNNHHGIRLSAYSSFNNVSGNNCTDNSEYGIILSFGNNNTVSGNNCTNDGTGIYLGYSHNNTVSENNCTDNAYGIWLRLSENNSIIKNICKISAQGIRLTEDSNFNTISGNNCTDSVNSGIILNSSNNNTVSENSCIDNQFGVFFSNSEANYNTIYKNNCSNNDYGIYLNEPKHANITENFLYFNYEYGVYISSLSENSLIYRNKFYNNNHSGFSQGYDDGVNNIWYCQLSSQGNGWSNWDGVGSYLIEGSANSEDLFPSLYPPAPIIESIIHLPSTPTDLDTIIITVTASAIFGLDSVTLHYRINSGSWSLTSMAISGDSTYQVIIGPFTVGSIVEYYITAIESSTLHRDATDDNGGMYYSFTVESPAVPEYSTINSILLFTAAILPLLIMLVINKRKKN